MANYRDIDDALFAERDIEAQSRKTGDFQEYWSPKVSRSGEFARNVIRIMPPHISMDADAFVTTKMHFLHERDQKTGLPIISPKTGRPVPIGINCLKFFGKPCAACSAVQEQLEEANALEGDEQARAVRLARDQSAKVRTFCSIVDIDNPGKGVQRYAFGPDIEKKLRSCFRDDNGAVRNITHPRTGRDVIMRVGKRQGTEFNEYDCRAKEASSPIPDMGWLDQITDLSELVREPNPLDMDQAVKGIRPQPSTVTRRPSPVQRETESTTDDEPKAKTKTKAEAKAEAKAETKSKRAAVPENETEPVATDPYADARALWQAGARRKPTLESGEPFKGIIDIKPEMVADVKKPGCWTKEPDVLDDTCRQCRLMLPCTTIKAQSAA